MLERKKAKVLNLLYDLELETGAVISCIIHAKSEWKWHEVTPIYQVIKEEGIAA